MRRFNHLTQDMYFRKGPIFPSIGLDVFCFLFCGRMVDLGDTLLFIGAFCLQQPPDWLVIFLTSCFTRSLTTFAPRLFTVFFTFSCEHVSRRLVLLAGLFTNSRHSSFKQEVLQNVLYFKKSFQYHSLSELVHHENQVDFLSWCIK